MIEYTDKYCIFDYIKLKNILLSWNRMRICRLKSNEPFEQFNFIGISIFVKFIVLLTG